MELLFDSLWDEHGELRRGCTVRQAAAWLVNFGGHSASECVCVNGVRYCLARLLYGPEYPAIVDRPISRICDGYYHQMNFSI